MSERTSISDEDEYTSFCEQASTRDEVFRTFKRDPRYRKVLEHVTPAEGMAYLSLIGQHYPFLGGYIDAFRANDSIGAPVTHDFGAPLGSWSPTTFRYAKVAGDLFTMFGGLEGCDIAEIGAGYGGQCLLLSKLLRWSSYTIFDLAPVQKLQRRYLSGFHVPGVAFESIDKLPRGRSYDLVISNYAFSECARAVQDRYLDKVVNGSSRGYLTCNNTADYVYSEPELRARIPHAIRLNEIPLTHPDNYLLVWKGSR
jgi:putative sugar O-methyltransferase